MTLPTIILDGYGIIVADTDGEIIYLSAADALDLAEQIIQYREPLEAIVARIKKVKTSNEAIQKMYNDPA